VLLNGVRHDTRLTATVGEVLQRREVTFTTCDKSNGRPELRLSGGRCTLDVLASKDFVPTEVKLTKVGIDNTAVTPTKQVDIWRPNPAELTLEVPSADEPSVLTVAQNYSNGWEAYDSTGRKLVPIRIGGWQQGWLLPSGPEQVVTARFLPDRSYRAGLLVGLFGFLLVAALAIFARRRSRHRAHRLKEARRLGPWVATGLAVAAGTFIAGWVGLAATAVAAVLAWYLQGRKPVLLGVVAGVVLLGGGIAAAQAWPDGDAGLNSGVVQASVLFGCALALLSRPTGDTS
jgi:arabinofuranan 3-O-arabinosyltransferase